MQVRRRPPGRRERLAGGVCPGKHDTTTMDGISIDPKLTRVWELAEPIALEAGLELVHVEHRREGHGAVLRLFIDKPGGITVDDCAAVSRQVSRVLEVEGVEYERLEVSSPGLDRRLRKAGDFARFSGQRAELRMRTPDAGGRRRFVGVLRGADAAQVSMELDGRTVALPLEDIERAKLVPEL